MEREETPERCMANLDSMQDTPAPLSVVKTPMTSGRIRPERQEMYPVRFQSTARKMESEKRTRLADNRSLLPTPTRPQEATCAPQGTPTRPGPAVSNPFLSPSFEFRFTRPSSDLSSEAQKMMEEVREKAARIKGDLVQKRDADVEEQVGNSAVGSPVARKIAIPKGRSGRFSDAHNEQFKKMDSIAGHPSAFRADPARVTTPKESMTPQKSLKRKGGTEELDRFFSNETAKDKSNEESTAKRAKANDNSFISRLTTPTRTSIARSNSVKSLSNAGSKIPSWSGHASPQQAHTPTPIKVHLSQTEKSHKTRDMFNSKLSSVKSILRRPTVRFSEDPLKVAAGTHLSLPKMTSMKLANIHKTLPSIPSNAFEMGRSEGTPKRVNFSPAPCKMISPINKASPGTPSTSKGQSLSMPVQDVISEALASPLPGKFQQQSRIPGDFTFRAEQTISFGSPSRPKIATPTIRRVRASDVSASKAVSPSKPEQIKVLPSVPHGLENKKRKSVSAAADQDEKKFIAPVAVQTKTLPSIPHGLENKKRKHESTISDKEQVEILPSIPHGLENKKRKRDSAAMGHDEKENIAPAAEPEHEERSPSKRARTAYGEEPESVKMPPSTRTPKRDNKGKGKGILSLSRLQALARPKTRK